MSHSRNNKVVPGTAAVYCRIGLGHAPQRDTSSIAEQMAILRAYVRTHGDELSNPALSSNSANAADRDVADHRAPDTDLRTPD